MDKAFFIFKGQHKDDGKRYFEYHKMPADKAVLFRKKLVGYEAIGSVVEAQTDSGGRSYWSGKYIGKVSKELYPEFLDSVPQWTAQSLAKQQAARAEAQGRKVHTNSIKSQVMEIRQHTVGMSRAEKALFALWVYNQLLK